MANTAEEARRYARTLREIKLHGVADAMDNYAALLEAQPELLRRLRAAEANAETLYGIAMNAAAWLAQNRTDGGPLNRHESEKLDERMCVKALDIRTAIDAARGRS